jgi:fructoselysine-6-P-deglycase FrlB-like protein
MKPSYENELQLLASSYDWASREDISPLDQLLDSVVSETALFIGSGGALAVAALASALHVAKTGRLATHATPLAIAVGPLRCSTAAILFSARAGHPDVALAARAALRQGCDPVGLITYRSVEDLSSSLARQPITIVIIPDTKEHNHKWKSSAYICIIRIDSHKDNPIKLSILNAVFSR